MMDDRTRRDYVTLRKQGVPAVPAYNTANYARKVRAWVTDNVSEVRDYDSPAGYSYQVKLGDWTCTVRFLVDEDAGRPEDNGDCYDAEDIAAWERDQWTFWQIDVTARNGQADGCDNLGTVDGGDWWQRHSLLDTEHQLWATVIEYDMLANARDAAIAELERSLTGARR